MHRRFVVAVALWGMTFGTACPETYGKKGALDDAMEEDVAEQHEEMLRQQGKPVPCRKKGERQVQVCSGATCHWECRK
jgi:hypothetical protein